MEIKFIKDHLTSSEGDVLNVTEQLGNYLIRCKVAILNEKKAKPIELVKEASKTKPKTKK